MMPSRTHIGSPYMQFAKLRSAAKYNLAASGIMSCPLAELPVKLEDLEINGPTLYGYAPLKERLARMNGVPPECVVTVAGTSMANHLALAATLEPGEEALVEHPTYELLVTTLQYLGATVRYFKRRMEDGFRVDEEEVERQMTPALTSMNGLCARSASWPGTTAHACWWTKSIWRRCTIGVRVRQYTWANTFW